MKKLLENIAKCRVFLDEPEDNKIDFELLEESLKEADTELRRIQDLNDTISELRKIIEDDIRGKMILLGMNTDIEKIATGELKELKREVDKKFEETYTVAGIKQQKDNELIETEKFKI